MLPPNEQLGWLWMLLGVLSGIALGLGFLTPTFLGGYDAPRRRLVRLGHIAFFGMGILNILYAHSFAPAITTSASRHLMVGGWAFMLAAVTMPLACFLTAWRLGFRHIFAVPVLAALLATGIATWEMLT